ncbi:MAG: glycosyl hydrolase family protein [Candidatus Xenobia bacterium]
MKIDSVNLAAWSAQPQTYTLAAPATEPASTFADRVLLSPLALANLAQQNDPPTEPGEGPLGNPQDVPSPVQNGVLPVQQTIGPVPQDAPDVPVHVQIGQPTATMVGSGFAGLSYETSTLYLDPNYFTPQNHQLVNLFKQMGMTSLRVGGDTVDYEKADPTQGQIDNLFRFAQQVPGLKVIYSLRMLNGNPQHDAQTAAYIWKHYPNQVQSFSIGNEPNNIKWFHDTSMQTSTLGAPGQSYVDRWLEFAKALHAAAPGAPISGPDWAVTGNPQWTDKFASEVEKAGIHLASINTHDYVTGNPKASAAEQVAVMLSPAAQNHEVQYDEDVARPLEQNGLKVDMTEDDDELLGNHGASDTMSSVLFAVNNMYQLAQGGVSHTYFHNLRQPTRTIYETPNGDVAVNPKGLAIAAFNRFAEGQVTPVHVSNPQGVNLHCYAVTHSNHDVTLALINQSYGPHGKNADVTLSLPAGATVTYLEAPHDNVQADTGVTLGGAQISAARRELDFRSIPVAPDAHGNVTVKVPACSIAFVSFPGQRVAAALSQPSSSQNELK